MTKPLHVINWQGKEYRIPFSILDLELDKDNLINVTNPYSKETATLPWFAVAVYKMIKDAEIKENYKLMQGGLSWFQKYFTNEYYTLLD
jgi:hypothetical protein